MDGNISFYDNLDDYMARKPVACILHILCTRGNMSLVFRDIRYNIAPRDYVILPNSSLATCFTASADFAAVIMSLSERFVSLMAIRSNYGIIGHLSLLQNPVMRLSEHDYDTCLGDMTRLRERLADETHLFREELIGNLLTAHIFDLYNIHARERSAELVSERTATLLRRFIEMLYGGDYVAHRDLDYYASRLCVTPHYLSEVCRKVCGRPATYWIDRFTASGIARMLARKDVSLTDVAEHFNFSSLSYFSRYVQRHLGVSPSTFRRDRV